MPQTGRNRPPEFAPLYRESFILAGIKSGKFQTTEIGLEKRCSCCREYWPADTTFFCIKNDRLDTLCRACAAEKAAARRSKHQADDNHMEHQ